LRLVQAANGMNELIGPQIEHLEGVVAQGGHKQALVHQVNEEVIDAAVHIGQAYGLNQTKWCTLLNVSCGRCQNKREAKKPDFLDRVPSH